MFYRQAQQHLRTFASVAVLTEIIEIEDPIPPIPSLFREMSCINKIYFVRTPEVQQIAAPFYIMDADRELRMRNVALRRPLAYRSTAQALLLLIVSSGAPVLARMAAGHRAWTTPWNRYFLPWRWHRPMISRALISWL